MDAKALTMACSHLVAIHGKVTLWPAAMQSGNISVPPSQVQWLSHLITGLINAFHYKHRAAQLCKVKLVLPALQLGEVVVMWQEVTGWFCSGRGTGSGWSSVTVEPDGVDGGGNGSTAVAPPLLFRLFVAERLALGEPEDVVGFLAPVPTGSSLRSQARTSPSAES